LGIAIAYGVNFPAWGAMFKLFRNILKDTHGWSADEYAFLDFLATPIPSFDQKILELLPEGEINSEDEKNIFLSNVKDLQAAEILFWDGV
jgi:hypothetical protein